MKYSQPTAKATKTPTFPSSFGSHITMLSEDYKDYNDAGTYLVICTDERGDYVTDRKTLDNGLCDRNRIATLETRQRELDIATIG